MTSLADVVVDGNDALPGNSENALKILREEIQNTSANTDTSRQTQDTDSSLPEKFRGKSAKDIADAYANLESRLGTMANDLGVQRQLTDRLLDLKRSGDLSRNDPNAQRKPMAVRTEELLDKPTETLDRVVDSRIRDLSQEVDQKIMQLRMGVAEAGFKGRHPDFQGVVTSPEFTQWVNKSAIRLRAAATANQGDWQVATELLDEFKASQQGSNKQNRVDDDDDANVKSARKAALDSSSGGGGSSAVDGNPRSKGKIYSRTDLMKLRIEQPDTYYDDAFQEKILLAYHEGRVK